MGDSLILGRIVTTGAQLPQAREGGLGGRFPQGLLHKALMRGQVLGARIIQLLSGGKAILELAGGRYAVDVSGLGELRAGQAITVRVRETGSRLELDLLAERTPAERNLASALRSLFTGAGTAESSQRLLQLVDSLLDSPDRQLPEELLSRLARQLAPLQIGEDSGRLAGEIRDLIRGLGLGLEAALRSGAANPADAEGLKGLLMRLVAALAARQAPGSAGKGTWALLDAFQARWAASFADKDPGFDQLVARARTAVGTAPQAGGGDRVASELAAVRGGLEALSRALSAPEAASFKRSIRELFEQLEQRLKGEIISREAGKRATELKDRLETIQLLNVNLKDRGLYQHLLFPVSILGEMTEVQVKQYLAGKGKGTGESLTAVLLLDLEATGRIRIDALLQQRVLYVNLYAERREVAALAAGMEAEFAEQLQARGFTLARMHTAVDERRVDDFHRFDAELFASENGLIDLQV